MTHRFGYRQFGAHGGDWGSTVTEQLARSHPNSVMAIHLTDVPFGHLFQKSDHAPQPEKKLFKHNEDWLKKRRDLRPNPINQTAESRTRLERFTGRLAAWLVENSGAGAIVATRSNRGSTRMSS
jgi:hypothetical protein